MGGILLANIDVHITPEIMEDAVDILYAKSITQIKTGP